LATKTLNARKLVTDLIVSQPLTIVIQHTTTPIPYLLTFVSTTSTQTPENLQSKALLIEGLGTTLTHEIESTIKAYVWLVARFL
jgi:hypothetical protein